MEITLNQVITGTMVLVALFVLCKAGSAFKSFTTSIINKVSNDNIIENIKLVEETVNSVVVYMNTTVVNDIKKASSDGKLTKEEAYEIFENAKGHIKRIIKGDTLEIISKVIGDVDEWLDVLIEKYVQVNK